MRVISGSARGRRLKEPEGYKVRPTTDMVKEAMFNIIQFQLPGARVLDLFAGTGQLGIESLSRGATSAVFVDESPAAAKLILDNLQTTRFAEQGELVRGDALGYVSRAAKFDVIFLDPPYDTALAPKALDRIIQFDILNENGIIICETKSDKTLPEAAAPYRKGREYRYGRIKITLYHKGFPDE